MARKIDWRKAHTDLWREWKAVNKQAFKFYNDKLAVLKILHDLADSGALQKLNKTQMKKFNRAIRILER